MSPKSEQDMSMSEDKKQELREAFNLFLTDDKDQAIDVSNLGIIARSLGQNPTEAELTTAANRFEGSDGRVSFDEFVQFFESCTDNRLTLEHVINAFRVFDAENVGYVQADELRRILSTLGEPLSAEELDEFIGDADVDGDGKINYRDYAKRLVT